MIKFLLGFFLKDVFYRINQLEYNQKQLQSELASLKGNKTVVANENRVIQLPSATSWLATAGTGDVLAGILGALLALNHEKVNKDNLVELGATASYIHAQSAAHSSKGPIDAGKLIDHISKEVARLSK